MLSICMSHRTWLLLCQLLSICSSYWPWNWPCVLCWSVTHLGDGCPLVQNTGLLCFPTLFHILTASLIKPKLGNSLHHRLCLVFWTSSCHYRSLPCFFSISLGIGVHSEGGISEYYNFCDWGINFHINTGYLVNFIKFWKQSFLYVILPMKCSIWKVFQLERTFQLYHL